MPSYAKHKKVMIAWGRFLVWRCTWHPAVQGRSHAQSQCWVHKIHSSPPWKSHPPGLAGPFPDANVWVALSIWLTRKLFTGQAGVRSKPQLDQRQHEQGCNQETAPDPAHSPQRCQLTAQHGKLMVTVIPREWLHAKRGFRG